MLHPANVTRRFIEPCEEIGLPPIRLHDLRHGAATPAHAAEADLKDIQEMLGHSSIAITADTYTSLLPETDRAIAEAAARLVPRARPMEPTTETVTDLEANEEPGTEPEAVTKGAGKSVAEHGSGAPSAHAPRTQTPRTRRTLTLSGILRVPGGRGSMINGHARLCSRTDAVVEVPIVAPRPCW
ncbi:MULTISPECIES: tyrosine-type recombinase/integrase [Streptomyces]|uniref:tyrosine-type recombinase/integrase n=1 Tax=Streptomyces TaxID=1883 RepID=UPI0034199257